MQLRIVNYKKMKKLPLLFLLVVICTFASSAFGQSANVTSLIKAVANKYPSSNYTLIQIGSTAYLIKGTSGKVLKTKKASSFGGVCSNYASLRTTSSDIRMREQSSGGGQIWKKSGKEWAHIATAEGEWQCDDVRSIPAAVRGCLGAGECF
jgi:hypothetical protein